MAIHSIKTTQDALILENALFLDGQSYHLKIERKDLNGRTIEVESNTPFLGLPIQQITKCANQIFRQIPNPQQTQVIYGRFLEERCVTVFENAEQMAGESITTWARSLYDHFTEVVTTGYSRNPNDSLVIYAQKAVPKLESEPVVASSVPPLAMSMPFPDCTPEIAPSEPAPSATAPVKKRKKRGELPSQSHEQPKSQDGGKKSLLTSFRKTDVEPVSPVPLAVNKLEEEHGKLEVHSRHPDQHPEMEKVYQAFQTLVKNPNDEGFLSNHVKEILIAKYQHLCQKHEKEFAARLALDFIYAGGKSKEILYNWLKDK